MKLLRCARQVSGPSSSPGSGGVGPGRFPGMRDLDKPSILICLGRGRGCTAEVNLGLDMKFQRPPLDLSIRKVLGWKFPKGLRRGFVRQNDPSEPGGKGLDLTRCSIRLARRCTHDPSMLVHEQPEPGLGPRPFGLKREARRCGT